MYNVHSYQFLSQYLESNIYFSFLVSNILWTSGVYNTFILPSMQVLNGKNHPYHLRNYARLKLLAPSKLMSGNSFEGLCMSLFDLFIEVATRLVSSYLFIGVATFYVPGQICGSSQLN